MTVDKTYCSSSYLMFRTMADSSKCFSEEYPLNLYKHRNREKLYPVYSGNDLIKYFQKRFSDICNHSKVALALSGGIDSAVLAHFMPKGSIVYTFKCVVPGVKVTDETLSAARYAEMNGLDHRIIEVYWDDFEKFAPVLMKHKGAPIHSIEVQIYKAAMQALSDGMDTIIFGESADLNYGGLSDLMSRDWTFGEFVDRYSYVKPYQVLKEFDLITEPYKMYEKNGKIDVHEFCRGFFLCEAMGSYTNACQTAGIELKTPYAETILAEPLDLLRIRTGENKYVVREAFSTLYPGFVMPPKTPMPRPMNEWMTEWQGPTRPEFWLHCTDHMTGDQKWMIWALERFLNLLEE